MTTHQPDEIKILDERTVLMEDEIGHVCVRLFNKGGNLSCGSIAYMGRQLSNDEAQTLLRLWNEIETFLKASATRILHTKPQTDNDYE